MVAPTFVNQKFLNLHYKWFYAKLTAIEGVIKSRELKLKISFPLREMLFIFLKFCRK